MQHVSSHSNSDSSPEVPPRGVILNDNIVERGAAVGERKTTSRSSNGIGIGEKTLSGPKPMPIAPQGGRAAFPSAAKYGKEKDYGKSKKKPSAFAAAANRHQDPNSLPPLPQDDEKPPHDHPEAGLSLPPEPHLETDSLSQLNQLDDGALAAKSCAKFLRSVVAAHKKLALEHLTQVSLRALKINEKGSSEKRDELQLSRYYEVFETTYFKGEEAGQNLFLIVRCMSDSSLSISDAALRLIESLLRQAYNRNTDTKVSSSSAGRSFVSADEIERAVLLSFIGNAGSAIQQHAISTIDPESKDVVNEEEEMELIIGGVTASSRPFSELSPQVSTNFPLSLAEVGFLSEVLRPRMLDQNFAAVANFLAQLSVQRSTSLKLSSAVVLLRKIQSSLSTFPVSAQDQGRLQELAHCMFLLHNVALHCGRKKLLLIHEWLISPLLITLRTLMEALQNRPDETKKQGESKSNESLSVSACNPGELRKVSVMCIFSFLRSCTLNRISLFGGMAEIIPLGARWGSFALLEAAIVAEDESVSKSSELQSYLVQDVPALATATDDIIMSCTALNVLSTWLHHFKFEAFSYGGANVQNTLDLIKELLMATTMQPHVLERSFSSLFPATKGLGQAVAGPQLIDTIARYCKVQFASACAATWPGVRDAVVDLFLSCFTRLEELEKKSNEKQLLHGPESGLTGCVLISRRGGAGGILQQPQEQQQPSSVVQSPSLDGFDAPCVELFSLVEMLDLFATLGKNNDDKFFRARSAKFAAFIGMEVVMHLKVGSDAIPQCVVPILMSGSASSNHISESRGVGGSFPLLSRFFVAKFESDGEGLTQPWSLAPILQTTSLGFDLNSTGMKQDREEEHGLNEEGVGGEGLGGGEDIETVAELSLEWANWYWDMVALQIVKPLKEPSRTSAAAGGTASPSLEKDEKKKKAETGTAAEKTVASVLASAATTTSNLGVDEGLLEATRQQHERSMGSSLDTVPTLANPLHLTQVILIAFLRSSAAIGAFEEGGEANTEAVDSHQNTFPKLIRLLESWFKNCTAVARTNGTASALAAYNTEEGFVAMSRRGCGGGAASHQSTWYFSQIDFHWQLLTSEFENSLNSQDPLVARGLALLLNPVLVRKETILSVMNLCCGTPAFLQEALAAKLLEDARDDEGKEEHEFSFSSFPSSFVDHLLFLRQFSLDDVRDLVQMVGQAHLRFRGGAVASESEQVSFLDAFTSKLRRAALEPLPLPSSSSRSAVTPKESAFFFFSEFEREIMEEELLEVPTLTSAPAEGSNNAHINGKEGSVGFEGFDENPGDEY